MWRIACYWFAPVRMSPVVRQRALESLGYSERPEVPILIEKALDSRDRAWICCGLFAISRSLDSRWEKQVLKFMDSPDDDVRFEAFRAAGELELEAARQPLLEKLDSGEEEGENRLAIIWSLSQIGGEDVQEAIEKSLEDCDDEEEAEYIEEAMDNLNFNQDFKLADLMNIEPEDPEEFNSGVDPMADSTGLERLHAFVHGRVQGVGFRAFVLQEASAMDLKGWCRNVGWDQVEVVAEGSRANLEGLLVELHRGPSMSAVEKVISEWTQGTGEFTQFRVR